MFSASDICKEIKNTGEILKQRGGKKGAETMAKGMVKNLCIKLSKLGTVTCDETKGLYESITCCDLAEPHKDALTKAVDKLVSQPLPETKVSIVLKPQLLTNVHVYWTQQDWDQLDDINKSWLAKTNVVVFKLKHLGFRSLHEQTSKFCLATLLSTLATQPDAGVAWEMLQDFKSCFHRCTQKPVAPFLQVFPAKPNDLPKLVFDAAYSQDDPLVMTHSNEEKVKEIAHKVVVCRSTSKKVAKAKALKSVPAAPTPAGQSAPSMPSSAGGNDFANFMTNFQNMQNMNPMQMMFGFMQAAMANNAMQAAMANLQPSPKKQKALPDGPASAASKDQLALPAPSSFEPKKRKVAETELEQNAPGPSNGAASEAAPEAAPAHQTCNGNPFEEETFNALLNRDKGKDMGQAKAKAKAKCKAKAKAKRKPAHAPMKRPSTKAIDFLVEKPSQDDLAKDPNVYHSRIWHQAKQFALKVLMKDEEAAKVYAKGKRAEANRFRVTARQ